MRCCRPKKFVRLPEGLSLHQPFQNRTIPLAFRNANICMHQYVFTSALSHENRQHPCLLMNALLVSHPCETLGVHFIRHPCLTRKLRVLPPPAPKIIPRLLSGRKCSGVVELRSLGSARPCADFVRPPSCIHARPASCGFSHPPTHKKCNPTQ